MAKYFPTGKIIKFHPVRGYATEEQYKKLQELPLGSERDKVIKDIELQTSRKGMM